MKVIRTSPVTSDGSLRRHIDNWLASWDFEGNPFGIWEASREPYLERYFVRRPFFEELLTSPKSTLIFAPRGGGKTAMRIMVEAECRPSITTNQVCAASFTDFSPFTESYRTVSRFTLGDYLPYLLSILVPAVLTSVVRSLISNTSLSEHQMGMLRYWLDNYDRGLFTVERICSLLRQIEPTYDDELRIRLAQQIVNGEPSAFRLSTRSATAARFLGSLGTAQPIFPNNALASPTNTLSAFVQAAIEMLGSGPTPCRTLFLLVDGIDEYALTQNDPDASAALLLPLIGNVRFLETPGFAAKFFLPTEHRTALEKVTRLDRLDVVDLAWETPVSGSDSDHLRELLRRRIAAFNTRGLRGLNELCVPAMRHWIEDAMLEEAGDSPRSLLRLGNLLFAEHCRGLPEPESVILPAEWERTLSRFRAALKHETSVERSHSQALHGPTSISQPAPRPQLRVDLKHGNVYRDLEELPPLPDLLYRLLAFLYRQKGQICTKDDIALAVFEPKYDLDAKRQDVGVSDEAISNLIYRLRKAIEPPDGPIYVKTIKGRGYRLDNAD